MENIVIGIDLGTTNSCAAYWIHQRLKVLENYEGGRITPSVVYYTEKDIPVVGPYAKTLALGRPDYAIFEIKRLIGRKLDDPFVQNNLRYFPFALDPDSNDPLVLVQQPEKSLRKSPLDICAAILKKIKEDVERKLNGTVSKVVITVPAYFNINQRTATFEAAQKVGFNVLKLLSEPTAAALSYYREGECDAEHISLVYDLGGGTFDVSIVKKSSQNIEILSVDGDSHLGGHDFDNLIIDYVCDELMKRYNYDPRSNRRAMRRLHNSCEEVKRLLSVTENTKIVLDAFIKDHDSIEITITRTQFEMMAKNLFRRTIRIVSNCLKSCNIPKSEIKEVILSGGSTRIPKIQEMLSEFFDGKTLNMFTNPDECVAEGAALQAAMLSTDPRQRITDVKISDVIPLSLGVDNFTGMMSFVIKRSVTIPVTSSVQHVTVYNNQKSISFGIYEGERLIAKKNVRIGSLQITNLTPGPPGASAITISLSVDMNGILTASAKEKCKDNVKDLQITYTRGQWSDSEVKNALKDAEDHKEEDEKFVKFARRKEYLLTYCIAIGWNMETKNLVAAHQEIYDWCENTRKTSSKMEVEEEAKLLELIKEVEAKTCYLGKEYGFKRMPLRTHV